MIQAPFLFALLFANPPANLQEPKGLVVEVPQRAEAVSFSGEILDILDAKCTGCHSSVLAENGLNMEDLPGMVQGGKRGPALVPGKADESLIFQMAAHRLEPVMPPREKTNLKPLDAQELGLLKLWIDQGAKDDSEEMASTDAPIELGELPPGVHPILALDTLANGSKVALGRANVVQVYDVDTGQEIIRLGGHKDLIQSVRFSPDGSKLAAGSYQIVTVWNVPAVKLERTLEGHAEGITALASVPNGSLFASCAMDGTIRLWQPGQDQTTREIQTPDKSPVLSIAMSSDGELLISGTKDGRIRVWSSADGTEKRAIDAQGGAIQAISMSPDKRQILAACEDGKARLWTLPDNPEEPLGDPVLVSGHEGAIRGLVFLPDGRFGTVGDDGNLFVWTLEGNEPKALIQKKAHEKPIHAIAASPNGSWMATASEDGTARLFRSEDGTPGPVLNGQTGAVRSVAFTPSGHRIATTGDQGGIKVWDVETGQGVQAFGLPGAGKPTEPVIALSFLDDQNLLAGSADRTVRQWSVTGGWSLDRVLEPHVFRVLSLDFSPDGKLLATGGGDPSRTGEVKVWDLQTGALKVDLPEWHSDTVFSVRFSPDGARLATAGADKFVRVLELAEQKQVRAFEGHTHHVLAVDWKNDGKQLISGGADNALKIWDVETGEQVRTCQDAGNQVTSIRWVADKPLVFGSSGDKTIRQWSPEDGRIKKTYSGATDYLYATACPLNGTLVFGGGEEGVLYIWNGEDGQLIRKIEVPADLGNPASGSPEAVSQ